MSTSRARVAGLAVVVTIHDNGTICHRVDTPETGVPLWNDVNSAFYGDTQVAADRAAVNADHERKVGAS